MSVTCCNTVSVKQVAHHLLGNVVLGGSQPAGHQHGVALLESVFKRLADSVAGVADGDDFSEGKAGGSKLLAYKSGVGVHHLADEEFVSNIDQYHNCNCFCKSILSIRLSIIRM